VLPQLADLIGIGRRVQHLLIHAVVVVELLDISLHLRRLSRNPAGPPAGPPRRHAIGRPRILGTRGLAAVSIGIRFNMAGVGANGGWDARHVFLQRSSTGYYLNKIYLFQSLVATGTL